MQPLTNTYNLVLSMRVAMLLRDFGPLSRAGDKIILALAHLNIKMHHILIHYPKQMYVLAEYYSSVFISENTSNIPFLEGNPFSQNITNPD